MQQGTPVGDTGLVLPRLAYGTSGLGNMPDTYGYAVDVERAVATVKAVLALPDGMLDTSRNYGMGRSEERIGLALRELGGWPAGRVLATKLDRDMATGRLDGERARRSLEESLAALGLDRVDVLQLHDPEHSADLGEITGRGGALEALFRMKEEGLATAVGLAAGRVDIMAPLIRDWDFDVMITHNRYTLLNRNAEPLIDLAVSRGVRVMNAAPYASGVLSKGPEEGRYAYQRPSEAVVAPVRRVEEICRVAGVPMGAAALQFSMRDPRIATTICGVTRPERVAQTEEWAAWPIPAEVWDELRALPYGMDDPEATRDYRPE